MIKAFLHDMAGNIAITTALLAVPLMGAAGLAVDYTVFTNQKFSLQEAADAAVLAAVKEAPLNSWDNSIVEGTVEHYLDVALTDNGFVSRGHKSAISLDKDAQTVSVTLEQDGDSYFMMGLLKGNPVIRIRIKRTIFGDERRYS